MKNKIRRGKIAPFFLLLTCAFLLILPNLLTRGMNIGSDALFHFNRFYETAMQIKTGHFDYFLSLFSFQQTGRIVNAFYGPLMAYFQGILVLLSGSWFHYQVLSNFLLYLISGISMYLLLRKNKVRVKVSLPLAIIYMTTFTIQYWNFRQGFTSWGASLLPLCLIPAKELLERQRIKPLPLAAAMALMFQTHILSSLMLAGIYGAFFVPSFFKASDKKALLKNLFIAIGLFFLLTSNIWVSLGFLYGSNTILAPYTNTTMYLNTIDSQSSYWLTYPCFFVIFMLLLCYLQIRYHHYFSLKNRLTFFTSLAFLLLSTSIIPWKFFIDRDIQLVEMVQFPFRFFVPYTVLMIFSFALSLEESPVPTRKIFRYMEVFAVISLVQILLLSGKTLELWSTRTSSYFEKRGTVMKTDIDTLKASFFQSDLALSLNYLEKPTPDYLPLYGTTKENKYTLYKNEILAVEDQFEKKVQGKTLQITWQGSEEKDIQVPIFVYQNTQLTLNGQTLDTSKLPLSAIGTPTVTQQAGENQLVLSFETPIFVRIALALTGLSWLSLLLTLFWQKNKIAVKHKKKPTSSC